MRVRVRLRVRVMVRVSSRTIIKLPYTPGSDRVSPAWLVTQSLSARRNQARQTTTARVCVCTCTRASVETSHPHFGCRKSSNQDVCVSLKPSVHISSGQTRIVIKSVSTKACWGRGGGGVCLTGVHYSCKHTAHAIHYCNPQSH